jgi:hypothetical protein
MKKKVPDNVVYNEKTHQFESHIKPYPTTVGSSSFFPLPIEKGDSHKANHFFEGKFTEIKKEYEKLVEEYRWTQLVYNADYNFQPLVNEPYHLYEREPSLYFLSLIGPTEWSEQYVGTFKLLTDGRWEKI